MQYYCYKSHSFINIHSLKKKINKNRTDVYQQPKIKKTRKIICSLLHIALNKKKTMIYCTKNSIAPIYHKYQVLDKQFLDYQIQQVI